MRASIVLLFIATACSGTERPSTQSVRPERGREAPESKDAAASTVAAIPPDAAPPADAEPALASRIELTFMGDVMCGGMFDGKWFPKDWENNDPLAEVKDFIASDLALANFESVVLDEIPEMTGTKRFVMTPAQASVLLAGGIHAVTLANNHINDLDAEGVLATAPKLREVGFQVIGEPRPEDEPLFQVDTMEVKGWKIGFVTGTTKLNRRNRKGAPQVPFVKDPNDFKDALLPAVEAARPDHDLVIVVVHWGVQYTDHPTAWQVEAAHAWIDAGADAVIGHHPHVLQGFERYKHGLIAYSLGNFVFQNGEAVVRDTGVLRVGFQRDGKCLDKVEFHPAILKRHPIHHPIKAEGKEFTEVETRVLKLSKKKPLVTEWQSDGAKLFTEGACAAQ